MVVQVLGLGLDPAWRRGGGGSACEEGRAFSAAVESAPGVTTLTYSCVGLRAGVDLILWRLAGCVEQLEEAAASALGTGLGRWLQVRQSLVGLIQPSPYARRPQPPQPALFGDRRSRYLIVYPFSKSAGWYRLSPETRKAAMAEHMRIGHAHGGVRQLLASSFGVDDMDFLVAYGTDDLGDFSELVRELRATEARRWTLRDTPILTAVHRPLPEITRLLGATQADLDAAGARGASPTRVLRGGGL
ncbi:MAG: chlorite dismutase family protein [Candidatus Dormibacteraeota bacterium]|nr:chlorite dismutase family protein [Candidatus Dormibacteraeota bacterium]